MAATGAHRIVCVTKETQADSEHEHVVEVGLGTEAGRVTAYLSVAEVREAIDRGDTFYTAGGARQARVAKFDCSCGVQTLRTHADDTQLDNLNRLPPCLPLD
jgi:hypothetical protein